MRRMLASWFGTGLIVRRLRGDDIGAGTVGAVFAFPVALLTGEWGGLGAQIVAAVAMFGLSVWSVGRFAESEGDAGWMVIDEAAGSFVAAIGLSFRPEAVVAFVVFRAADIFKTRFPGVAAAERSLPGAVGITADDLVAGAYGLAAGRVARAVL